MEYGDAHKQWQLLRRGRYIEFNLLFDRGVKFGLSGRCAHTLLYDRRAPPDRRAACWQLLKQPSALAGPQASARALLRCCPPPPLFCPQGGGWRASWCQRRPWWPGSTMCSLSRAAGRRSWCRCCTRRASGCKPGNERSGQAGRNSQLAPRQITAAHTDTATLMIDDPRIHLLPPTHTLRSARRSQQLGRAGCWLALLPPGAAHRGRGPGCAAGRGRSQEAGPAILLAMACGVQWPVMQCLSCCAPQRARQRHRVTGVSSRRSVSTHFHQQQSGGHKSTPCLGGVSAVWRADRARPGRLAAVVGVLGSCWVMFGSCPAAAPAGSACGQ